MKQNFLSFILVVIAILGCSSCAQTTYKASTHVEYSPEIMEYYYNSRMKSDVHLTAKAQVHIFLSEKEINGDYSVISLNSYRPVRFSFLTNFKRKMSKKFYQTAVLKAYEQGGNGIIITSVGTYKVINITNWDAEAEAPAIYVNAIFDRKLMEKFLNGDVAKSKKADIKRYEKQFGEEITENVKTAKTLEEIDVIKEKIAAYKNYNSSLDKPKSAISKLIEKQEKSLVRIEKKVTKKTSKTK